MEHFIISLLKTASKHNWPIRVSTMRKDSWWCPLKTLDRVTLPGRGQSTRKQQWNGIWMWFLEILSLKIRFVSYSESRIKLIKQKELEPDVQMSLQNLNDVSRNSLHLFWLRQIHLIKEAINSKLEGYTFFFN